MKIGYARVSTAEQNLDLQRDALKAAGCEKVITDKASGATAARPGLEKVKELLRAGDTLVVWRLDRLGRSLRDLIGWMTYLDEEKVGLLSLHEAIDTTTTSGKLTFHLFGALAEFERNLIRERTQAGLTAARARGKKVAGRPHSARTSATCPSGSTTRTRCRSPRFARCSASPSQNSTPMCDRLRPSR
jgi:DNA invertase Pin-like site-specific DNA recombinase